VSKQLAQGRIVAGPGCEPLGPKARALTATPLSLSTNSSVTNDRLGTTSFILVRTAQSLAAVSPRIK